MDVNSLVIVKYVTNKPINEKKEKIKELRSKIYDVADEISKLSLIKEIEINVKLKFEYKEDNYIGFEFNPLCFAEAYDSILDQYYSVKLHLILDELEDIRLLRRILKVFKQELKEIKKGIKEGQYD